MPRAIKMLAKYGGYVKVDVTQLQQGSFLNDKNILLTGGGTGIGLAIAKRCLQEGAKVVIAGRNKDKLNKISSELNNSNLFILEFDISKTNDIEGKVKEAESLIGSEINVLVNNAGTYAQTHFPNVNEEDWTRVYNTNAKGTFFLSQALCRLWLKCKKQNTRKILNISSQGGFVGANNAYRMTKWDIRGLTEYMGKEYSRKGIITNAIAPGLIMTNMQPDFQKQEDNFFTDLNPSERLALPEEIAELALFLISNASNFIVGQTIVCDGGYVLK